MCSGKAEKHLSRMPAESYYRSMSCGTTLRQVSSSRMPSSSECRACTRHCQNPGNPFSTERNSPTPQAGAPSAQDLNTSQRGSEKQESVSASHFKLYIEALHAEHIAEHRMADECCSRLRCAGYKALRKSPQPLTEMILMDRILTNSPDKPPASAPKPQKMQSPLETLPHTQRVHVGIWYILTQRGSHIPNLRPKYIPYTYMDPLGQRLLSSFCPFRLVSMDLYESPAQH